MANSPDAMGIPELVAFLTPAQKVWVTDHLRRLVKRNAVKKLEHDKGGHSKVRLFKPSKSNNKPVISPKPSSEVSLDTKTPIECSACNRSFAALEDLKRHYETKHLGPDKAKRGQVGRRPLSGGLCNGK